MRDETLFHDNLSDMRRKYLGSEFCSGYTSIWPGKKRTRGRNVNLTGGRSPHL